MAENATTGTESRVNPLVSLGFKLREEFNEAAKLRREREKEWLKDLHQFRGVYEPEVLAKIPKNRSKAFFRLTRAKVKSADARMMELLFPAGDKNYTINATPVPEVDKALLATEIELITQRDGQLDEEALRKAIEALAKERAGKMEMEIDDQLKEGNYEAVCRQVIHSGHKFGTGVLKGPMVETTTVPRWVQAPAGSGTEAQFQLKEIERRRPWFAFVPIWNVYPDPHALTLDECDYLYERHVLTKHEVRKLMKRKGFDAGAIREYLATNPKGDITKLLEHEADLRNVSKDDQKTTIGKYEVLERWGVIDGLYLREAGIDIPDEALGLEFEAQIWVLGDKVIRVLPNATAQASRPYKFYYFEKDETSIWGDGVPAVMRDPQSLANASVRILVDNAAMSAGPILEGNMELLEDESDPSAVYPFRFYMRRGGDPVAPALRTYTIPNNTAQIMALLKFFMDMADEVTTLPRFTYGQPDKGGASDTVGGLSMLMGQANITLKDMAKNFDDGVTTPFITDMYHWNMQFSDRQDIKGDYEVIARGSSSLVAKEVRARALDNFAATTANPIDAPFIKRDELNRQRAKALDISPDELVKTPDEVEQENAQAQMIQALRQAITVVAQQLGTTPEALIQQAAMGGMPPQQPQQPQQPQPHPLEGGK